MKYLIIVLLFISSQLYGQSPATGGYLLIKSNGAVSIGTEVNTAPLTISNFTTSFVTPQVGTMLHLVSDAAINGRVSFDTYNNTSFTGSNYQGRRARGTAGSPTPALLDDILVAIGADGYGVDSFTNASVGSMNIRANGTFTNTSKPTYISFTTTPSGSITQVERLRIKPDGTVQITGLNAAGVVQTDASGNLSTGNVAQSSVTNLVSDLAAKQATLVSATNIKTVNGSSLLGSGDLVVSGGSSRVFLPNDVINNNGSANTIADVTGLSFPVVANTTYKFRFWIVYSSAATTTGSRWSINGPATTFLNYFSNYTLTATSITNNQGLASYNVPAGASASSLTANNVAIIEGVIRPSADGTVIARFASEISASAITAIASGKSYVEYQIIN